MSYYCDMEKTGCIARAVTRCKFDRLEEEHIMYWRYNECEIPFNEMILIDEDLTIVKNRIEEW